MGGGQFLFGQCPNRGCNFFNGASLKNLAIIGNSNIITYICKHMHQQCDYICDHMHQVQFGVVSCVTAGGPGSSQGRMYLYFPPAICNLKQNTRFILQLLGCGLLRTICKFTQILWIYYMHLFEFTMCSPILVYANLLRENFVAK